MKYRLVLLATVAALSSGQVLAEETKRNWKASTELGFNFTSGNTKTSSMKTRVDFKQNLAHWRNKYVFDALRKKDNGTESANKWLFSAKANYKLDEKNAVLFIAGSREEDKFAVYDNYNTITVGYGNRLYESSSVTIDADIGPGYAFFERNDVAMESEHAFIVTATGDLSWKVSDNADFGQKLIIDQKLNDDKNTKSRWESSISASINSSLKMKLALTVLNNSDVPVGTKKTDTETSVTLVYAF